MLMYVVVDIGGTKIRIASFTGEGKMTADHHFLTPREAAEATEQIAGTIESIIGSTDLRGIVVASPGPLDRKDGKILNPPNLPWHNLDITNILQKRFNVPVILENDHDLGAFGEAELGAGRRYNPVLFVTISTGIGTGLIIDHEIYHGAFDTEGGHIIIKPDGPKCACGGFGHFEALVSGPAIKRRFGRAAYDIFDKPTWDYIARDMALGLISLINMVSPEIVVIGGGVGVHFDKFDAPLKKHLQNLSTLYPVPKVVPAKFVETAPLYGGFLLATRAFPPHK